MARRNEEVAALLREYADLLSITGGDACRARSYEKAALRGELPGVLPGVLTERELRGDPHTRTDLTDGVAPLEEMLDAAARRGYAYYAVTDHAPNLLHGGPRDADPPADPGLREPTRTCTSSATRRRGCSASARAWTRTGTPSSTPAPAPARPRR